MNKYGKFAIRGLVAPFAAATVTGNLAAIGIGTLQKGELVSTFYEASNMAQGTGTILAMAAAGATGYLLAKREKSAEVELNAE